MASVLALGLKPHMEPSFVPLVSLQPELCAVPRGHYRSSRGAPREGLETKLVKTAGRSALAGGGERDRSLDNCKAPEAGWLVSHNRLGQASASPDSSPRRDSGGPA